MKALLICPAERSQVALLAESAPLSNLSIFGKELICYWVEHLVACGAKEILVLATDRPTQVRAALGDGSRWGIRIEVVPERRELAPAEALAKYCGENKTGWMPEPENAAVLDHLPGFPDINLFTSYSDLVVALQSFLPKTETPDRIGLRQIQPGVWAGLRAQISPRAKLHAPCWISDNVSIGENAVVGPMAILEKNVVVDCGANVRNSLVAPETYIGKYTTVRNSIAAGNTLINWEKESHVKIGDAFLLCSLREHRPFRDAARWPARIAALLAMIATSPLALAWITAALLRWQPIFRERRAVRPGFAGFSKSVVYYEFAHTNGLWRRWPQLWSVVRGDFNWIGNRPLTAEQVSLLANDFERLWINAPLGLLSQADAAGCLDQFSDEARAHSSFYATQASFRLNASIFCRIFLSLILPKYLSGRPSHSAVLEPQKIPITHSVSH